MKWIKSVFKFFSALKEFVQTYLYLNRHFSDDILRSLTVVQLLIIADSRKTGEVTKEKAFSLLRERFVKFIADLPDDDERTYTPGDYFEEQDKRWEDIHALKVDWMDLTYDEFRSAVQETISRISAEKAKDKNDESAQEEPENE